MEHLRYQTLMLKDAMLRDVYVVFVMLRFVAVSSCRLYSSFCLILDLYEKGPSNLHIDLSTLYVGLLNNRVKKASNLE
jgi:hypothetical protein